MITYKFADQTWKFCHPDDLIEAGNAAFYFLLNTFRYKENKPYLLIINTDFNEVFIMKNENVKDDLELHFHNQRMRKESVNFNLFTSPNPHELLKIANNETNKEWQFYIDEQTTQPVIY